MPTESHSYRFSQDYSNFLTQDKRTGKFVGTAVLLDSTRPKILKVLAVIKGEITPIRLPVFIPEQEEADQADKAFPYRTDEAKKLITVNADVQVRSEKELLFLSPLFWTVPFHRSVYDLDVEFNTINKAIFSPKDE